MKTVPPRPGRPRRARRPGDRQQRRRREGRARVAQHRAAAGFGPADRVVEVRLPRQRADDPVQPAEHDLAAAQVADALDPQARALGLGRAAPPPGRARDGAEGRVEPPVAEQAGLQAARFGIAITIEPAGLEQPRRPRDRARRPQVLERVPEDERRPTRASACETRAGAHVGAEGLALQAQGASRPVNGEAHRAGRRRRSRRRAPVLPEHDGRSGAPKGFWLRAALWVSPGPAETPRWGAVPGLVAREIPLGRPGHCRAGAARSAAQNRPARHGGAPKGGAAPEAGGSTHPAVDETRAGRGLAVPSRRGSAPVAEVYRGRGEWGGDTRRARRTTDP